MSAPRTQIQSPVSVDKLIQQFNETLDKAIPEDFKQLTLAKVAKDIAAQLKLKLEKNKSSLVSEDKGVEEKSINSAKYMNEGTDIAKIKQWLETELSYRKAYLANINATNVILIRQNILDTEKCIENLFTSLSHLEDKDKLKYCGDYFRLVQVMDPTHRDDSLSNFSRMVVTNYIQHGGEVNLSVYLLSVEKLGIHKKKEIAHIRGHLQLLKCVCTHFKLGIAYEEKSLRVARKSIDALKMITTSAISQTQVEQLDDINVLNALSLLIEPLVAHYENNNIQVFNSLQSSVATLHKLKAKLNDMTEVLELFSFLYLTLLDFEGCKQFHRKLAIKEAVSNKKSSEEESYLAGFSFLKLIAERSIPEKTNKSYAAAMLFLLQVYAELNDTEKENIARVNYMQCYVIESAPKLFYTHSQAILKNYQDIYSLSLNQMAILTYAVANIIYVAREELEEKLKFYMTKKEVFDMFKHDFSRDQDKVTESIFLGSQSILYMMAVLNYASNHQFNEIRRYSDLLFALPKQTIETTLDNFKTRLIKNITELSLIKENEASLVVEYLLEKLKSFQPGQSIIEAINSEKSYEKLLEEEKSSKSSKSSSSQVIIKLTDKEKLQNGLADLKRSLQILKSDWQSLVGELKAQDIEVKIKKSEIDSISEQLENLKVGESKNVAADKTKLSKLDQRLKEMMKGVQNQRQKDLISQRSAHKTEEKKEDSQRKVDSLNTAESSVKKIRPSKAERARRRQEKNNNLQKQEELEDQLPEAPGGVSISSLSIFNRRADAGDRTQLTSWDKLPSPEI